MPFMHGSSMATPAMIIPGVSRTPHHLHHARAARLREAHYQNAREQQGGNVKPGGVVP